ncbi:class I SAM-dependent RNA methyltransferase, partial [Candidatus Falkowbacteria bacterium]|nr:class I SAM-dependent RNA methyltransferase [Candidatus Falkowbacteria bacterium]
MILTVERLSLTAEGVARGTQGATYIAGALPGEVVEGEPVAGRIAAPKIITSSPDRVRPPCPHARACGGCTLQHASDAFVARWKAEVVRLALAGQGLEAPVLETETSPARSRRRATLAGRRVKSGVLVGFHARASETVVEVPECLLLRPELIACLPALREAAAWAAENFGKIDILFANAEEAGLLTSAKDVPQMAQEMRNS